MKMHLIIISAVLMLAAPGFAGSPDNPGVGGEAVTNTGTVYKAGGGNFGDYATAWKGTDYSVGKAVQDTKTAFGGDPNPANDNGGGND